MATWFVYDPLCKFELMGELKTSTKCNFMVIICGDQLLVNCLYIQVLYKQDAVSVTRLQCICGISDFELSIIAFKSISCNVKLNAYTFRAL